MYFMIKIITSLSAEKRLEYLENNLKSTDFGVLVVPEQFLFETERSMYRLLGARKIAVTDITGLSKLAADVIKKYGEPKLYADDIVKTVTMYKTLRRLKRRAAYDSASRMLSVIADFKSAAITPDALGDSLVGIENEGLSVKLSDISEVYSAYTETLSAEFADKLDDCRVATDLIGKHDCFRGKRVFLYEFDGFSASQLGLVKAISESAEGVEILLRTDDRVSGNPAFRALNSVIARVEREASCGFESLGGESYSPVTELWTADNVCDEAEFVAREIRRLILSEDYTCNQIAVLTCDNVNPNRLREAMAEYDIPCYADLPEPILTKSMTRFMIAALEAVGLDTPKLLTYIRSGFVRVHCNLENYESCRNIRLGNFSGREKRYLFDKGGSRLTRRMSKRSMDLLERVAFRFALSKREWGKAFPPGNPDLRAVEPLREEVVKPLLDLRQVCENQTGDVITERLCDFLLEHMQLQKTVVGLSNGNDALSSEFRQLWDLSIDVFESLHAALKGEPISLEEYTELLRGVFSAVNIAKPPQVLDSVVIGDLARSRISGIRAAFVVGANLGDFPKSSAVTGDSAFTGREIEELTAVGLEITAQSEERYNFERLMVNKAMTLPSERLYLCAPLSDSAWNELAVSPVFGESGMTVRHYAAGTPRSSDGTPRSSDGTPRSSCPTEEHSLSCETAERLFNIEKFSPTAIETMMSCRFKFFCKYGLMLDIPVTENEEEPIAMERGNIIHHCLDRALRAGESLNDSDLEGFVEACIREYREKKLPSGYAQTKRGEYILMGFKTGLVRMIKHIRGEIASSGFKPIDFERKVDFTFGSVRIGGIIDRIDRSTPGGELVRVIDYKSGNKEMDFPSVFYGLDLQMLLYLFSSTENAKPDSALYLPSDGAKVKGVLLPGASDDDKHGNWLSVHSPSGIAVDSQSVASKKVKLLSHDEYERLKDYCGKLVDTRIRQLKRGRIEAVPIESSCDYCEYSFGCYKRRVKKINKDLIGRIVKSTHG
jgi:ATP-dependent helicase/nuclease subunit B